ncbi:MAG TPA: nucleotide exchange factor GrpE [Candidatus Limnocylindrales bacterium]|nr:nucleotide exchange factor GrpE [Candidatus Limnocylindrales bacterium]
MSKSNGQAEIPVNEEQKVEQELPAADPGDGFQERAEPASAAEAAAQTPETEKIRAERDSLLDRLARLQAEFDNFRKRSARENENFREYAVGEAARGLLPVIDSFGLALKNADAKPEDLRKGVELIYKQLQDALQRMNVQRVPAQGEPFDPRLHEAIEMVPSDEVPDNHVLEELQPGYRIKDRLLRPAMVRVAKKIS